MKYLLLLLLSITLIGCDNITDEPEPSKLRITSDDPVFISGYADGDHFARYEKTYTADQTSQYSIEVATDHAFIFESVQGDFLYTERTLFYSNSGEFVIYQFPAGVMTIIYP